MAYCLVGRCGLALLICVGLSSCGSEPAPQLPDATHSVAPAVDAPLPFPDDRLASELTETTVVGINAEARGAHAFPYGSALKLNGVMANSRLAWALYRFNTGGLAADSVNVILEPVATTGAFIGVANQATERWEFDGPFSESKTLPVDAARYISPAGNVWVAVVAPAGKTAFINAVSFRAVSETQPNQPPTAVLDARVLSNSSSPLPVICDASESVDPDGEIVEYAWDLDNNGAYEQFAEDPTIFAYYDVPFYRTVRLRVTDDDGARAYAEQQVSSNDVPHGDPTAAFSFAPGTGAAPLEVFFDARESHGFFNQAVSLYEWDWEGDAIYDSSGTWPMASHVFTTPGLHDVWLRVTDNWGQTATVGAGWGIRVEPLWTDLDPAPGAQVYYHSWAVVGGKPAVAYTKSDGISYVQATAADGSGWSAPLVLTTTGSGPLSLAEINGKPAVAYNGPNAELRYQVALDGSGTLWSAPLAIASGRYPSLAAVDGRPALVYAGIFGSDIFYMRALDVDGLAWDLPFGFQDGASPQLIDVGGKPAVAFSSIEAVYPHRLYYQHAADASGTFWPVGQELLSGNATAGFSLEKVNGLPALAAPLGGGGVKYMQALDAEGAAWGAQVMVGLHVSESVSLAEVEGRPALTLAASTAYGTSVIRYLQAADSAGTAWGTSSIIALGRHPQLLSLPGNPLAGIIELGELDALRRD
jgi:hypothetical protein